MKLVKKESLIEKDEFLNSKGYQTVDDDVTKGIRKIAWPPEDDQFIVRPESHCNGVGPIKDAFITTLKDRGWNPEERLDIAVNKRPGPIDAVYEFDDGDYFAVEWETGNISSSHRAINKICVGILENTLKGGILVLPSRELYPYLTDRVGNYPKLVPYFPVWKAVQVSEGYLGIYVVEHDGTSDTVETIDKGTDGRALI